MTVLVRKLKIS